MSEPLQAALTSLLIGAGLDPTIASTLAGILLGATLTLVMFIALEWAVGGKQSNDKTFIFSAMLGMGISAILGWFPIWLPFVVFFTMLFFILRPLGQGGPLG